mmetsp:Transcript_53173/g.92792  ORF Transcript_53173/g.92792 Transcript_53173/m.92792 type:complete len:217 (+) Transcript_53173:93-743(+)
MGSVPTMRFISLGGDSWDTSIRAMVKLRTPMASKRSAMRLKYTAKCAQGSQSCACNNNTTSFWSFNTISSKFFRVTVTTAWSPRIPSPNCSEIPCTTAGAFFGALRTAWFFGLIGSADCRAFLAISLASSAERTLPLIKSAQNCRMVSLLTGSSSGKGTCAPSRVLKASEGRRSLPPYKPNDFIWSWCSTPLRYTNKMRCWCSLAARRNSSRRISL